MHSFSSGTRDPRRRPLGPPPLPILPAGIPRGSIPPHLIDSDHIAAKGVSLESVSFDRAAFAFDLTQVSDYFVNVTAWKRVGNVSGQDAQAHIGATDRELYVWVWATFGWANGDAGDHGQWTAALYNNDVTYQRASNVASTWLPGDGSFRECTYLGFFVVPVIDGADWSVGLQQRFAAAGRNLQSINRQSIIAFISGAPDDAASNADLAVAGDEE